MSSDSRALTRRQHSDEDFHPSLPSAPQHQMPDPSSELLARYMNIVNEVNTFVPGYAVEMKWKDAQGDASGINRDRKQFKVLKTKTLKAIHDLVSEEQAPPPVYDTFELIEWVPGCDPLKDQTDRDYAQGS